jgi:galactofuranosylgalactofuranosylrhamnosyl-N-acetylglucosaminyl-diphospho-decaprenol beta-1,5/1,6-galactofuranosyltransferase
MEPPADTAGNSVPEPSEGAARTRLVVQRGLFFGPSALVPEDLYSTVEKGSARRERSQVALGPNTRVNTNTYFGRFHATYWQRWTDVGEIEVDAVVTGTGRVRLLASDTNKVWRIIEARDVRDAEGSTIRLTGPVDRFVDGGGMWLELTTETGHLTVADVRWAVSGPRRGPRTDVVICTYNRVDDCLNTLQAMVADPEALSCIGTVQVVDQGSDPLESRPRFAEVAAGLGERLRDVRQPNLEGSPAGCSTPRRASPTTTPTSFSWTTTSCWTPRSSSGSPASPRAPATRRSSAGRCSTCCTPRTCTSPPSTPTPNCSRSACPCPAH